MANNKKVMDSIKGFLLKMKALDEQLPEELAQDALEMTEEVKDALCEETEEVVKDESLEEAATGEPEVDPTKDACVEGEIEKKVEDAMVKVLRKYGLVQDSAMKALDELEKEIVEGEETSDVDGEEAVTVDPETMNDTAALLRKVKPVIAGVKDSKQRKILADSFAKAIKMNTKTADYSGVAKLAKANAADSMANVKKASDADYDLGMEIAKKFNPHYTK